MAINNTRLGGTDNTNGSVIDAADTNDVNDAVQGYLGEVRMFALSETSAVTKATLQGQGWAICDGTTPAAQSISSPTMTAATPDLQDSFISMSNDETSGSTGGSSTHNHQWLTTTIGASDPTTYDSAGSSKNVDTHEGEDPGEDVISANRTANTYYTSKVDTRPPFYELVLFMKVR